VTIAFACAALSRLVCSRVVADETASQLVRTVIASPRVRERTS
jgi:hypothetical protein